MVVQTDFFLCQIKILHLGSFERPYIVSLKKSIVICCFQHLLPWKQSKMATKQPFQKSTGKHSTIGDIECYYCIKCYYKASLMNT